MSTQRVELSELERRIETAFDAVPYPGDNDIAPHSCLECDEIREVFTGKHWRDLVVVPPPAERICACTSFLSAKAFHFFSPFLLTMALRTVGTANYRDPLWADAFDSFISSLRPTPKGWEGWRERLHLFSNDQLEITVQALNFIAKAHRDRGSIRKTIAVLKGREWREQRP